MQTVQWDLSVSRQARLGLFCAFAILAIAMILKLTKRASAGSDDLSIYYTACQLLWEGKSPYLGGKTSYLYPPFFAFLITPLTLLGPQVFAVVWGLALGGLWITAIYLCHRLISPTDAFSWLDIIPSFILFRWILSGWGHGQVALVLVVLTLLAIRAERAGRDYIAAGLIALAGAIKIFPLYLGLLFLKPFRPRPVILLGAVTVLLHSAPCLWLGTDRYFGVALAGFARVALPEIDAQRSFWDNRAPSAALARATGVSDPAIQRFAVLVWMTITAAILIRLERPRRHSADTPWLALLIGSMTLAPPVVWPHYFTLLLLPVSLLVRRASENVSSRLAVHLCRASLAFAFVSFCLSASGLVGAELVRALSPAELPTLGAMAVWVAALLTSASSRVSGSDLPASTEHHLAVRASPEA